MRRPRVLLVDDDELVRVSVSRGMRGELDVVVADGAPAARVHLAAEPFDAIVSDHNMPGGLGADFLAEVASAFPGVLLILVSGEDIPAQRPLDGSWHHFFPKPYPVPHIIRLIIAHARR